MSGAESEGPASTVERTAASPLAVFPRESDPRPEARLLARWLAARGDCPELIEHLQEAVRRHGRPIRLAVVGGLDDKRVDFINALLGRRVLPYGSAVPHLVRYGRRARARAVDAEGRTQSVGFEPGRSVVASAKLDPEVVQRVDVKAPLDSLRRTTLLDGGASLASARETLPQVVGAEVILLLPNDGEWASIPAWVSEAAIPVVAVFDDPSVPEPLTDWSCRFDARKALEALARRDQNALRGSGLFALTQALQGGPFLYVGRQRDERLSQTLNQVVADAQARTRVAASVTRLRRDDAEEIRRLEQANAAAQAAAEAAERQHAETVTQLRSSAAQVETALTARIEELEQALERAEHSARSLRKAQVAGESQLARAMQAKNTAESDVQDALAQIERLRAQAADADARHDAALEQERARRREALEAQAANYARMLEEAQRAAAAGSELAEQLNEAQRAHAEELRALEEKHEAELQASHDAAEAELTRHVSALTAERDDIIRSARERYATQLSQLEDDHLAKLSELAAEAERVESEALAEAHRQIDQLRNELAARAEQAAATERAHGLALEAAQKSHQLEIAELRASHAKAIQAATEAHQQIIMELEGRLGDATTKAVNNELRAQELLEANDRLRAAAQQWESSGPDAARAEAWTSAPPRPVPPEISSTDSMSALKFGPDGAVIGRIVSAQPAGLRELEQPGAADREASNSSLWPMGTPAPVDTTPVPDAVLRRLDRARALHGQIGRITAVQMLGVEPGASEIRLREAHAARLREYDLERFSRYNLDANALRQLRELIQAFDDALARQLAPELALDDTLDGSGFGAAREIAAAMQPAGDGDSAAEDDGLGDLAEALAEPIADGVADSSFALESIEEGMGSADTAPPPSVDPPAELGLVGPPRPAPEPPPPHLLDVVHATARAADFIEAHNIELALRWWRAIRTAQDGPLPRAGEIYCVYRLAGGTSPERVAAALRAFAEVSKDSPLPYLYLGRVLRDMRERQQAIAAYEKALELDPKCQPAGDELRNIWRRAVPAAETPAAVGWGDD